MADVFLSYARDDREAAERLAVALEAEGFSVWWDRHLIGGSEFARDIERELDACQVVVVAWSDAARQSPWVKDEAGVGQEAGKLVALALDDKPPPLGFRQYHATDLSTWNGDPAGVEFKALVTAIEARRRGATAVETAHRPREVASRSGRRSHRWWLPVLSLLVAALVLQQIFRGAGDEPSRNPTVDAAPRLAVAPLKARGQDDVAEAAEALTESIASGLSRFPHLNVTTGFVGERPAQPEPTYLLEGALVRAGPTLRLTVQLFKTGNGEQVWGEAYDRTYSESSMLDVQDDLTASVVASVADSFGALMRDLSSDVTQRAPEDLTAYEAVLRHLVYRQRLGPEEHAASRSALENAVQQSPGDSNVQAALSAVYVDEYKHSYNPLPDSLDRALGAAREAVTLEPANAYAHFSLAEVQYFRQDPGAFLASAERAIELNPYDSDSLAMIGVLMCYGGYWERGVALSRRAMALNPNHPGWYRFGIAFDQLRRKEYPAALETAQRINLPNYFADALVRTLAHAYLGNTGEAEAAAEEFLSLWPPGDLASFRSQNMDRWFYASPELTRLTLEGLERAGISSD